MSIDLQGKLKNFIKNPDFDTYDKYWKYLENGILTDQNNLVAQELCKDWGDSQFVQLYKLDGNIYDKYNYCIIKSHIGTCSGCLEADIEVLEELKDEIKKNVLKAHLFHEYEEASKEYNNMIQDMGINKNAKIMHP